MNINAKKLLPMPVKGLGCENYFPLLETSQWFSSQERGHFTHCKKSGQERLSIGSATFEGGFLAVLGSTPLTVF